MDIAFELLLLIIRFLAELFFQFFGELILQMVFEALAELGIRCFSKPLRIPRPPAWLAVVGYLFLGAMAGALSVWFVPSLVIDRPWVRIINISVAPLAAGALMAKVGAWRSRRGDELIRLDHFAYGFLFALAMSLVRFFLAR